MTFSAYAESLPDEVLAGQRLVVGFEGRSLDEDLRALIRDLHVGGLILFKRNVSDPGQLADLCRRAQEYALETGNPRLLIAIDQEGGPVARLGPPFTVFPGNRAIGDAGSHDAAKAFGETSARELKEVGVSMNLAPVIDVVPEGLQDAVMANRVFGRSPELVAGLGRTVIEALQANGVAACAKHFPGIGRTTVDSHLDLPLLEARREEFDGSDWIPFRNAIAAGVAAVMLSHVIYTDLDSRWPASLSPFVAKGLLRDYMGFAGAVITDDLDMGAIGDRYGPEEITAQIVGGDIDLALICHDREKMEKIYKVLCNLIAKRQEGRARTLQSVARILRLKADFAP